jgi:twitching motility protein PilJ
VLLVLGMLAVVLQGAGESGSRTAAGSPGLAGLLTAQSAVLRARQVLGGDVDAFSELEEAARALRSASAGGLTTEQKQALDGVKASVDAIIGGRDALTTLNDAAAELDTLVPALAERSYVLEGELTLQRRPAVIAQLERLRLLGDSLRTGVGALLRGGVEPATAAQELLDAELAMGQIVRGFQSGDPELGLAAVGDGGARKALDAVVATKDDLSNKVGDVLEVADRLAAIEQARAQMDTLAGQLIPTRLGSGSASAGISGGLLAGLLGATMAVLLVLGWLYYRSAGSRRATQVQSEQNERNQQAIMRLLDELSSLADGDLTVNATVTEDITGAIADSINFAIEALRDLVTTLNSSAIMVDGAAKQTDLTAQQLAEASEAQSKQIEAASVAIARMASSIEEVSGNAERSSDVARHSVEVAHKGGEAVRRTIDGMNAIRETIQETSKRIKRLGESSQEIGDIIELINDIADQTNILALNASIQASMAGEAGRGFAVVADEVQRLAERSANATKQIEALVRTIQTDTNEAVVSMERSTTDVVGGALLAENAGAALEEIEQVSNQIASLVQNISGSAREQARATATVTRNMDVLQEISSQTAAGTSETTESIRKLAALAAQLRQSVAGFRLPETAGRDGLSSQPVRADSPSALGAAEQVEVAFADQKTA